MSKQDINLINIELTSLNAQQLSREDSKELELAIQNGVDVLSVSDGQLKLKVYEKMYFKPEGPFKLDLEIVGTFETQGTPIPEEELNEIAKPLFAYGSGIISYITEKFLGVPIIVPPEKIEV